HLLLAGVLLGLATIKPHLAAPFGAWFFLWTLGDWSRRQRLLWSFAGTLALLLLGSEMILPGWFARWWSTVQAFRGYQKPPLAQVLLGESGGTIFVVIVVLAVAAVCWKQRREPAGSTRFAAMLALVAAAGVAVLPNADAVYDHLLLLPGVLWLAAQAGEFARWRFARRFVLVLVGGLFAWQWLMAAAVAIRALVAPAGQEPSLFLLSLPIRTAAALPFVLLMMVALLVRDQFRASPPATVARPGSGG
ncbi:MAG: hypothetical protein L0099_09480, partial [Acidobacteria bacterium]|nr:hypothetical protein [Acidobacteriota bacterium]